MMQKFGRALKIIVVLTMTLLPFSVQAAEKMLYPAVDSHLHYTDFTQRTDGFEALTQKMDQAGVTRAVIFGMPIVKMWSESDPVRPSYYLDTDSRSYYYSATDFLLAEDLRRQPSSVQQRFSPFITGINPLDQNAAEYIETLLRLHPGFWKGIGEVMSRHDDLTAFTYGKPPRADHSALMRVYELAARHSLPVLMHHNISSANRRDPIYLPELERAVAANPATTFIWAHAGISRRVDIPALRDELSRVLDAYPNLYIDISWVVYPDYIVKDDASLAAWIMLIEKFPDRIFIGSDKVGHWDTYPEEMTKYNLLLSRLSSSTARKIAQENIQRLLAK